MSLDPAAVWLWVPALGRSEEDGWLLEPAWVLSVSGLLDLAWGPKLAVPPEPLQVSAMVAAVSYLGWLSEPGF